MSRFFVGQRVKKVRGDHRNIGVTGRVVDFDVPLRNAMGGDDMRVSADTAGFCLDGLPYPAGFVGCADSRNWEPILEKHDPCEEDFKRDLDRLLEREGVAA